MEQKKIAFNPLPSHEGRQSQMGERRNPGAFNPLPSHEGRPCGLITHIASCHLSIHFPLTREDAMEAKVEFPGATFQSTSLSRGKTGGVYG